MTFETEKFQSSKHNSAFNQEDFDIVLLELYDEIKNEAIHTEIYNFYYQNIKILDLGFLKITETETLKNILHFISKKNKRFFLISPSIDIMADILRIQSNLREQLSVTFIDTFVDENTPMWQEFFKIEKFLDRKFFFGYQNYLISPNEYELLRQANVTTVRISEFKEQNKFLPIRNANLVSMNMNALKFSDFPAATNPQPNGLTALDACKIAYITGISDISDFFGVFNYDLKTDIRNVSAKLIAQIFLHYVQGLSFIKSNIKTNRKEFVVFVGDALPSKDITFVYDENLKLWFYKNQEGKLVACDYADYENAKKGNIDFLLKK